MITILIPIYNARSETLRLLDTLERDPPQAYVLLLDDASPDVDLAQALLARAQRNPSWRYVRNRRNRGFGGTINRGMRLCAPHDAVWLNSDTVPAKGWLNRLRDCAAAFPRAGMISPLSNDAALCSWPRVHACDDPEPLQALLHAHHTPCYPTLPVGNGFCLYVRRPCWDAVGPLDPAFGRGYGEETDLCLRAVAAGWECRLCDDTIVAHVHGASFVDTKERAALRRKAEALVLARYPDYQERVRAWQIADPLRASRYRARYSRTSRLRVLQAVHCMGLRAGTELHVQDMHREYSRTCDSIVVAPRATPEALADPALIHYDLPVGRLRPLVQGYTACLDSHLARRWWRDVLDATRPDIVHLQHLVGYGTLAVAEICREMGIPCALSIHDYYYLCPDWSLLGRGERCGGVMGSPECSSCAAHVSDEYARARRAAIVAMLDSLSGVDVISEYAREIHRPALGDRVDGWERLPYGSALPREACPAEYHGELHVAALGNLTQAKGSDDVIALARMGATHGIRVHHYGAIDPRIEAEVRATPEIELHGGYDREELPALLAPMHAVLIASRFAETFCQTADQAMSLGKPLLTTARGAIQERIRPGVDALVYSSGDAQGLLHAARAMMVPDVLASLTEGAREYSTHTTAEIAAARLSWYSRLLGR
jgi:GT2 family glycosyltransferase